MSIGKHIIEESPKPFTIAGLGRLGEGRGSAGRRSWVANVKQSFDGAIASATGAVDAASSAAATWCCYLELQFHPVPVLTVCCNTTQANRI